MIQTKLALTAADKYDIAYEYIVKKLAHTAILFHIDSAVGTAPTYSMMRDQIIAALFPVPGQSVPESQAQEEWRHAQMDSDIAMAGGA